MRIEQGVKVFYGDPDIKKVKNQDFFLVKEIAENYFWLYKKYATGFLMTGVKINNKDTALEIAKMLNEDLKRGDV